MKVYVIMVSPGHRLLTPHAYKTRLQADEVLKTVLKDRSILVKIIDFIGKYRLYVKELQVVDENPFVD
jgi:hypothetical protein